MNSFSLKKIILIALTLSFVVTPATYAKGRAKVLKSVTKAIQAQVEKQRHVEFEEFIRTELFFGSAKPDGTVVTEADWQQFLNTHITPRFPDGLTVLGGFGQFRNSDGIIVRERSTVLILLYPVQTRRSSSEKIEQIRRLYKAAFQQESVLRADDVLPVKVSF